jgi:lipid-binding SYLF domain-containing protein
MKQAILSVVAAAAIAFPVFAAPTAGDTPAEERQEAIEQAQKAAKIFDEIMGIEESAIPDELLKDAEVIAIFPDVVKAAFIFGGSGGKGIVSARDPQTGRWGPPVFLKIGGASWGAQIGAESADFVMVGISRDAQKIFEKEEWTIGAEAGFAAGPVGRKAKAGTDWKLDGQWASYSRSKGAFAGLSLGGSKVKLDDDMNKAVYGPSVAVGHVLMGHATMDPSVSAIMVFPQTLAKYGRPMPD